MHNLQPAIFLLDVVQAGSPADGYRQQIGVDRLLVEIIGAHGDSAHCIGSVVMTGDDDHLGVRCERQHLFEQTETLGDAPRIGRQTEIQGDYRRLQPAQLGQGAIAIFGDRDIEILEAPLELTLQTRVVLYDQQFVFGFCHRLAILSLIGRLSHLNRIPDLRPRAA
jgi:hypothetical protein